MNLPENNRYTSIQKTAKAASMPWKHNHHIIEADHVETNYLFIMEH